ncbi:uncharacterized protein LOC134193180 isoform X2 [Corticium candelabrum]|uniref:uncharacterized protein LOC134193180 isoform X2 n=1 Tax=Corticium candelabrum TaxID=121492 RepID=UPI002E26ED03|nr:uncharacterized protein LOC134193180 isoform X2 [Corticium candelabrum]
MSLGELIDKLITLVVIIIAMAFIMAFTSESAIDDGNTRSALKIPKNDDKHFLHLAIFGGSFQEDVGSQPTLRLELHMLESNDTLKELIDIYEKSDPPLKLIAGPSNAIGINRSGNMKLKVVNNDIWTVKNTPEELQTPLNNIWAAKHFKFPNSMFLEYAGTAPYRPEIVIAVNYSGNTETLTGHPSMQPQVQQTSSPAIGTTASGLNSDIIGANYVFAGQNDVNIHNHFWQENKCNTV